MFVVYILIFKACENPNKNYTAINRDYQMDEEKLSSALKLLSTKPDILENIKNRQPCRETSNKKTSLRNQTEKLKRKMCSFNESETDDEYLSSETYIPKKRKKLNLHVENGVQLDSFNISYVGFVTLHKINSTPEIEKSELLKSKRNEINSLIDMYNTKAWFLHRDLVKSIAFFIKLSENLKSKKMLSLTVEELNFKKNKIKANIDSYNILFNKFENSLNAIPVELSRDIDNDILTKNISCINQLIETYKRICNECELLINNLFNKNIK